MKPIITFATNEEERSQIDAIRKPFYGGFPLLNDPDVTYRITKRGDRVTACYGIKVDGKRGLVVDFYGTNAADWERLLADLLAAADHHDLELSAWVQVGNKNIKYFWKRGFSPQLVLIRRQPEHKEVK